MRFEKNNRFEGQCLKNLLLVYMEIMKVKNSIFFINFAPEIHCRNKDIMNIYYNDEPLLDQFADCISVCRGQGYDLAWYNNLLTLHNNSPVMIQGDMFYIPYHMYFKKMHGTHVFIISDYESTSKTVGVIDWYYPHYHIGRLSEEVLQTIRTSQNPKDNNPFSGEPIDAAYYNFDHTKLSGSPDELINMNLLKIREYFSCNSSDGSNLVKRMCERLFAQDILRLDIDVIVRTFSTIREGLHLLIVKWQLIPYFLQLANHTSFLHANHLQEITAKTAHEWKIFSNMLVKFEYAKNREFINSLLSKFSFIIGLEQQVYEELETVISRYSTP